MAKPQFKDHDRTRRPGPVPRAGFTSASQSVQDLAGDGYSALALAQNEHPDLVLLDLALPGFATGAVVLKHMRTFPSLAPIPAIVLTGQDLRQHKEPMLELGAAGCFQKPVDNEELLDLIRVSLSPTA